MLRLLIVGMFVFLIFFWNKKTMRKMPYSAEGVVDALLAWERSQNFPPPNLSTATCPDPPDKLMTPHILWTFLTLLNCYITEADQVLTIPVSPEAHLRETMTQEELIVLFMRVERFNKMRFEETNTSSLNTQGWEISSTIAATLAMREGIAPTALCACIKGITDPANKDKMVFYNRLANFTRSHIPEWVPPPDTKGSSN